MTDKPTSKSSRVSLGPIQSGIMFWLLTSISFAVLAPCILVPEWQRYQAASVVEQAAQHRIAELQNELDRQTRLLDAVRSDPAVIARLALRDLSLVRRNEHAILVPVRADDLVEADATFAPVLPAPPAPVSRILAHLPAYDYAGLFNDEQTRIILISMSSGLLALAFALFGRPRPAPQPQ